MPLPTSLLRSVIGRRLLALFVGCSLAPIALLAALSVRHMTAELELQSRRRLEQENQALARAVTDRLQLLEATLKGIPPRAVSELAGGTPRRPIRSRPDSPPPAGNRPPGARGDGRIAVGGIELERKRRPPPPAPRKVDPEVRGTIRAGFDLLAASRFASLQWVDARGGKTQLVGRGSALPSLDDADSAYVLGGGTLVRVRRDSAGSQVFMVGRPERAGHAPGFFVGEISPEFLWGAEGQSLGTPTTRMAVLDAVGEPLTGENPEVVPGTLRDPALRGSGAFESRLGGAGYVSVYRPIVLEEPFAASNWTLVLSEPKQVVLAPVTEFRSTFFVIVAGCTLFVFLLSVSQIRRSLAPLALLQEGTRRIALRDFHTRVTLPSGDEFAELADSFNAMATRLGKQFKALATAAEIDRAVLSATDADSIVDAVLARIGDVYPCRAASVTLVSSERSAAGRTWVQAYTNGRRRLSATVELDAIQLRLLATGPEVVELEAGDVLPPYLRPLAAFGAGSFVVLPLSYHQQLCGVLALGAAPDAGRAPEDLVQARRLADQIAVALSNARMIEQVRLLAYADSLTGLLNRASYKQHLAATIATARPQNRSVGVFFIDLDNFGRINDTLGHELGDELLRQVAVRIRGCRSDDDPGAEAAAPPEVARLGGDEFTVLLPGPTDAAKAVALARRVLAALAPPCQLGTHEVFVSASIGIALFPDDGEDVETLLAHADTAMYEAKRQGGNGYQLFARSMNATALQRLTLEGDLRRALERDELVLQYQPIVDATSMRIAGAEALVRWKHPVLGLLLPSEFVPIAEENGLIVPLGEWVLRAACRQNRAWQDAGLPPIRVTVNVSSRQLRQGGLVDAVGAALADAGLAARWLGLELTESVLMDRRHEAVGALNQLRALGVQLSIDDFGTGYSSLAYLKHFPVDALKIDRSFVRDLVTVSDDAAITAAIIAMARALGLKVVAEGVESEAHLAFLRSQGCDEAQGHLIGRPMAPELLAERLARSLTGAKATRRERRSSTLAS
ncbi:MAG TPA: EAL domain-containing protein [Gemmatimonadales bacterium]|nr:EAL domain-containing protein [Gemmatimonadales bacterium]